MCKTWVIHMIYSKKRRVSGKWGQSSIYRYGGQYKGLPGKVFFTRKEKTDGGMWFWGAMESEGFGQA